MLYRIKGIKRKLGIKFRQLNGSQAQEVIQERKTFYVEAVNFQKATTRAKKILDHVHEVSQVQGEIA